MEVSLRGPNFGSRRAFFVVYFRMPPVTLILASRWSTTDELTGQDLEGSGRSIARYYPSMCLECVRKTMKNLIQDCR